MKSSHRFICPCDLEQTTFSITDPDLCSQIMNVLRLKADDKVFICDGRGNEVEARILELGKKGIMLEKIRMFKPDQQDLKKIHVYCSILKRENFELVVQKCTEIGTASIIPILTKRTVKSGLKLDRLRKIAKEAAEQSGRLQVPIIGDPKDFSKAIEEAEGERIFFHLERWPRKMASKISPNIRSLFIGPEGGWDEQEINLAEQYNSLILSLGQLALRAETAAIIACYLAYHDLI